MTVTNLDVAPIKPAILLLEDDIELRFILADSLRDAGFRVVETTSSDDALKHLKDFNDVNLVIADIKVPGAVDGHELALIVAQDFPSLKVILTSGYKKEPVPEGVLFIRKPYILSRVIADARSMLKLSGEN